ncbi:hypothetical protein PFLA_a3686 [Pseudoalteromonas flavipulchra NCIMB 2033 = ATCC BAA-314]|nr:hypothetical protein [Pseudoalteromonas flavipulchra NCIMB 2033 = ATCC BAA-314]
MKTSWFEFFFYSSNWMQSGHLFYPTIPRFIPSYCYLSKFRLIVRCIGAL